MILTATVLSVLAALGIIYIGVRYLTSPVAIAQGFGVPDLPVPTDPFYRVKGIRDVASGLVVLALLADGDHSATGWVILVLAVVPIGDMLIVLTHRGRRSTAYGVHGATALVLVVSAGLWLLG